MQKNKSILNQKCKCGEPIDFFELREHSRNETMNWNTKVYKFLFIFMIIASFLICIRIYMIYSTIINDVVYTLGLLYGFFFGSIFGMLILSYTDYKKMRRYNAKRDRKEYYHHKVRWSYYKSLSKKKQKALLKGSSFILLVSITPFLLIAFIMFSFMDNQLNEWSLIVIIGGFLIYLALWKIDPFTPFLRKLTINKLKEQGIDYNLFNRGVKTK